MNIILIGYSGCGKSTLGKSLANRLDFRFFDTDAEIIKKYQYQSINEIFDIEGEQYFRQLEKDVMYDSFENTVIATGAGLPIIPGMMDFLNKLGTTIYLIVSFDKLWQRIGHLDDRPLLNKGFQLERESIYNQSQICFLTDGMSLEEIESKLCTIKF